MLACRLINWGLISKLSKGAPAAPSESWYTSVAWIYLYGVGFSPPHVEFVVAHAEGEDALVDSQPGREEDKVWRFRVDGLDDELPVVERDVPDLGPGEANFGGQSVLLLVDVESQGVHTQPQFRT